MHEFGWIAEDLTALEERLDDKALAPRAQALRRALQRAFVEACKAEREVRREREAAASAAQSGRRARGLAAARAA